MLESKKTSDDNLSSGLIVRDKKTLGVLVTTMEKVDQESLLSTIFTHPRNLTQKIWFRKF